MFKEQKKLTDIALLEKIQDETYWRKKYTQEMIESAKEAASDSDRKKRLERRLCKHCYYLRADILAFSAMTAVRCQICEKDMLFGSTHTDKICTDCAKKHKLCRQCFSDIDFKTRRKV